MPHVLIVDKDPVLGRALEARLASQPEGVRVVSARTLEEASRLLVEHRPVLVVADCNVPGGDGLRWYRWASVSYPESRFALMSWEPVSPQAWTGIDNAVAFWMRPFDCERVVRLLDEVLSEPVLAEAAVGDGLRSRLGALAAGLWEVRDVLAGGDLSESSLLGLAQDKVEPLLSLASEISESMRVRADAGDSVDHRMRNHMATVLAGVYVLAGELRSGALEPGQAGRLARGVVEELMEKVGLICAMLECNRCA
jgi:response regulator RpfG family c-di-GMP phosphodiesterase